MNGREVLFSIGGGIAALMLRDPAWAGELEISNGTDGYTYGKQLRAENSRYTISGTTNGGR